MLNFLFHHNGHAFTVAAKDVDSANTQALLFCQNLPSHGLPVFMGIVARH